jgi:hypothetical protein
MMPVSFTNTLLHTILAHYPSLKGKYGDGSPVRLTRRYWSITFYPQVSFTLLSSFKVRLLTQSSFSGSVKTSSRGVKSTKSMG